jgi:hypothetical protein
MIVVRWNYASSVAHVRAPRYRLPTTRLDLQQRRRSLTAGTSSRVLPGTTQRWLRLPPFSPNRSPNMGAGRRAPSASCGRPRRPTSSARVRPASLRKDPVFTGWLDQSGHMTIGSARPRALPVAATTPEYIYTGRTIDDCFGSFATAPYRRCVPSRPATHRWASAFSTRLSKPLCWGS